MKNQTVIINNTTIREGKQSSNVAFNVYVHHD